MHRHKILTLLWTGLVLLPGCQVKRDKLDQRLYFDDWVEGPIGSAHQRVLIRTLEIGVADIPASMICKVYTANDNRINVNIMGPDCQCDTLIAVRRQDLSCKITKAGSYVLRVWPTIDGQQTDVKYLCFKVPNQLSLPSAAETTPSAAETTPSAGTVDSSNTDRPIAKKPGTSSKTNRKSAEAGDSSGPLRAGPGKIEPSKTEPGKVGPPAVKSPVPERPAVQREITAVRGLPPAELTLACDEPLPNGGSGQIGLLDDADKTKKQWVTGHFSVSDAANCDIAVTKFGNPVLLRRKQNVSLWF